jgi:hypothetical protein
MSPRRRGGAIVGHVLDGTGHPVAATHIEVLSPAGSVVANAVSDAAGAYRTKNLAAGRYLVQAEPPPGYVVPAPIPASVTTATDTAMEIRLIGGVIVGPTGPVGPIGPMGLTGPIGPTGATNPSGPVAPIAASGPGGLSLPAGPVAPGLGSSEATSVTAPGDDTVVEFFATLDGPDLMIEAPVSEQEAIQAMNLFSVVNVYLGSVSTRRVGNEDKMDVLGMLTLYYGLQDRSIPPTIVTHTPQLWTEVQDDLKELRDTLELLGSDVMFLAKEARRQFNLGFNHDVTGNTEFPTLFQRYVEVGNDPLLTLDLGVEETSAFSDKTQIARAYDRLAELKDLTLQIVRTLSKNGTVATDQINRQWAEYENHAFAVLKKVADARISDDEDDLRILSVVADLIGRDLLTDLAPYVALARDGGALLNLAMEAYRTSIQRLDSFDRTELLRVFQSGAPAAFLTTRIRSRAMVVAKYPLRNWGVA